MEQTESRAGVREWLGLAVLALPTLLVSMDVGVLHLAVPAITASLGASATEMLWTIDIYGFMIAGFLVTMGTLGDRIGRRRLLLMGGVAFAAASVLAAFAPTPETLIAARALLGIAGATLMPSTLSLIVNMFTNGRQRGTAIAVWVTMFSVGTALGPVVGGAMLELFWWGSVFLIAVPIMVVLLVAGPALLPEFRDDTAGRVDLVSVGLSLAAILPLVYGLKTLATGGSTTAGVLTILAGILFAAAFVRRQRTTSDPLLDLALFRNRGFAPAVIALLASMFVAGGTYLFVTQYLQLVGDRSPLEAGLWLLPAAGALVVTSMLAPALAARFPVSHVVAGGFVLAGIGHAMLALVGTDDLALLVVAFLIVYAGGGPVVALGTDLILGSAPPEKAGSASSVSETATEFGMALGVAALGALGTAVYRAFSTVPAGVGPDVAAAANDSLAGLTGAVAALPPAVADVVLEPNRLAFVDGLNAIGLVSAVLSLAVAVTVVVSTPESTTPTEPAPEDAPESRDDATASVPS